MHKLRHHTNQMSSTKNDERQKSMPLFLLTTSKNYDAGHMVTQRPAANEHVNTIFTLKKSITEGDPLTLLSFFSLKNKIKFKETKSEVPGRRRFPHPRWSAESDVRGPTQRGFYL